jgi:hypothetical protein
MKSGWGFSYAMGEIEIVFSRDSRSERRAVVSGMIAN